VTVEAEAAAGIAPTHQGFSAREKGWMLFLMFLMMASNYVDRSIIRILAQPIKAEFHLSDFQVGILGGFSFAMLYMILGIPVARLAERKSRVNIITIAVVIWSLMTALCGLATNYLQLLLFRVGVGVGESGAAPPSQSLITDYFPPHQRSSAISVHSFGIAMGGLGGSVIGGLVAEAWGWRPALLVVGVPGLLLALLIKLTVKEPPRGYSDSGAKALQAQEDAPGLWETARTLFTNPTFANLAAGAAITNLAIQGIHTFEAAYFVRRFGVGLGEIGLVVGILGGIATGAGMLIGGVTADWVGKRDRRLYAWLPAAGLAVSGPMIALAFFQANWVTSAILLAAPGVTLMLFHAPAQAVIHNLAHPRSRATAISLYMLCTASVGLALGPVVVGILSDILSGLAHAGGPAAFAADCPGGTALEAADAATSAGCLSASAEGVRQAMVACTALYLWGALHFVFAGFSIGKTVKAGG
jgi:MFS family permease